MKRFLVICIVTALTAIGSVAVAQDNKTVDPKVTSQVENLLASFEYIPTPEDWAKIGPDAAQVLRTVAEDKKRRATTRSRAVSSLAYFGADADTNAFLETILKDEKSPILLRRKAVLAISLAKGDAALPTLQPLAAHSNDRLRETAIRALGNIKTVEAKTLLQERLELEPKNYLKDEIRASIRRIDVKKTP